MATEGKTAEVKKADAAEGEDGRVVPHDRLVACIKEAVSKLGPEITKEEKIRQAKLLLNIFENGVTPMRAMGMADRDIAPIYALAFNMFRAGKFAESAEYYKVLLLLDPFRPSFSMALGACYHRLKQYDKAALLYMQASLYDNVDPLPFFYCYDCFMHLNDPQSAAIMLPNVIERAGTIEKYKAIKQRAQLLLDEYLKAGGKSTQGSA